MTKESTGLRIYISKTESALAKHTLEEKNKIKSVIL